MRQINGMVSGIVSVALGVTLLEQMPVSSIWFIGFAMNVQAATLSPWVCRSIKAKIMRRSDEDAQCSSSSARSRSTDQRSDIPGCLYQAGKRELRSRALALR